MKIYVIHFFSTLCIHKIFNSKNSEFLYISGSRACSECSSECGCEDHLDDEGPNQVNFLATTNEVVGSPTGQKPLPGDHEKITGPTPPSNDLTMQLHRVLGSLESEIEHRKQNKTTTGVEGKERPTNAPNTVDASEVDLESNFLGEAGEVKTNSFRLLILFSRLFIVFFHFS